MACVLEDEVLDECRQDAVCFGSNETCAQALAVKDCLGGMAARAAVERLERGTAANDCYSVFEDDALVVDTRFNEQGVAGAAVVDAQADGFLGCIPALAILAVLAVYTDVPRGSRRAERSCHAEHQYVKEAFHFISFGL